MNKISIIVKKENKKINLEVYQCNYFERFLGLMFSRRQNAKALLFDFGKKVKTPIHSFFVFYSFMAVWLDDKGKILEKRIVSPWKVSISPSVKYRKLVETPLNGKYDDVLTFLDGS